MRADRVRAVGLSVAAVTPRTRWTFVEIETDDGWRGVGEATLPGHETAVADAVAALAPAVFALSGDDLPALPGRPPTALPAAAARSALDQALWDVAARRRGERLAEALGTVRRERVPVYANINRRAVDRSPETFAACARAAIAAGHRAIKLAPFDEATPARCRGDPVAAIASGLARVAAVREAIGDAPALMIDCHWRLDFVAAERAAAAAADLGVSWLECPLPEEIETIAAITRVRAAANRRGIVLAGLETAIGVEGFRPYVDAGAYDVVMPDIKYVGGIGEMLRLAEMLEDAGVGLSPHNPSGPVCHAASLQLCAVVSSLHSLETQFDETPLFTALAGTDLHATSEGTMAVPEGLGIGAALRAEMLDGCRVMQRTTTRDG